MEVGSYVGGFSRGKLLYALPFVYMLPELGVAYPKGPGVEH